VADKLEELLDPGELEALFRPVPAESDGQQSSRSSAGEREAFRTTPNAEARGENEAFPENDIDDLPDDFLPDNALLSEPRSFQFEDFSADVSTSTRPAPELTPETELEVQVELGRTDLPADQVQALQAGGVLLLDKLAGDPVDILAEGRLIARGEVLVLNDRFCVRIAEVLGL